jgi:hypothetical protein
VMIIARKLFVVCINKQIEYVDEESLCCFFIVKTSISNNLKTKFYNDQLETKDSSIQPTATNTDSEQFYELFDVKIDDALHL